MKLFSMEHGGFFDLPRAYSRLCGSRVVIVPWGFERTTSYKKGTAKAPRALLCASHEVEWYDETFACETYKRVGGIATLRFPRIRKNHAAALKDLEEIVAALITEDKFPFIVGGEHSISCAPIRAFAKRYKNLSILHFDAHADLRPSYCGTKYSHASAMYLCINDAQKIISLGIRSISKEEKAVLKKYRSKIDIYWWRRDLYPRRGALKAVGKEAARKLGKRPVYLSFDVDAFDPAVIGSSTGTPEPGGFSFDDVLDIFGGILPRINLVGADIVEHLPVKGQHAPDFTVAKLAYKLLGFVNFS